MRRVGGFALFVLGFVLIFLAPLIRFYAVPRLEKAPTDVYQTNISTGSVRYFSSKLLSYTNTRPFENIQIYKGNPQTSTKTVIVVSAFSRAFDTQANFDISYGQDIYTFDRNTGFAVHCCGETPKHEGVTLKFPFHTQKKTYPLYDDVAFKAFPAVYVGTQTLDGLLTYHFVSRVPPTDIGPFPNFPGGLVGHPDEPSVTAETHYSGVTEVWIEPTTGAVIKGARIAQQWATDSAGQGFAALAQINAAYDPATVQTNVDDVKSKASQLKFISGPGLISLPVLGIILALLGVLLLRKAPAEREPEQREAQTAAA